MSYLLMLQFDTSPNYISIFVLSLFNLDYKSVSLIDRKLNSYNVMDLFSF